MLDSVHGAWFISWSLAPKWKRLCDQEVMLGDGRVPAPSYVSLSSRQRAWERSAGKRKES